MVTRIIDGDDVLKNDVPNNSRYRFAVIKNTIFNQMKEMFKSEKFLSNLKSKAD